MDIWTFNKNISPQIESWILIVNLSTLQILSASVFFC